MREYRAVTLTFREENLSTIGSLLSNPAHIYPSNSTAHFDKLLKALNQEEVFYLITCNRILFLFFGEEPPKNWTTSLIRFFHLSMDEAQTNQWASKMIVLQGIKAVHHIYEVACSLNSLVIGEREILGQFRTAYKYGQENGIVKTHLRLLLDHVIKTAKQVYTDTLIADNPVSVVSLSIQKIRRLNPPKDSRIWLIGAGQTNSLVAKYLQKEGFLYVSIFNRTLEKAKEIALLFEQGQAHLLSALHEISPDFDILISCVDTQHEIIPTSLLEGQCNKIFVDLAIQSNIPVTEKLQKENHHINIDGLRDLAHENMQLRKKEIAKAKTILTKNQEEFQLMWKQRKVTNAMAEIPLKIKDIKHKAIENVFQAEIALMDDQSRLTLNKVLDYMESKYIAIPISIAKKAVEA